jgi:CcmE
MTRKKRRLVLISAALAVLGVAVGLVLVALRDNIVFFYGPSELAQKAPRAGQRLRIGGLVKQEAIALRSCSHAIGGLRSAHVQRQGGKCRNRSWSTSRSSVSCSRG